MDCRGNCSLGPVGVGVAVEVAVGVGSGVAVAVGVGVGVGVSALEMRLPTPNVKNNTAAETAPTPAATLGRMEERCALCGV